MDDIKSHRFGMRIMKNNRFKSKSKSFFFFFTKSLTQIAGWFIFVCFKGYVYAHKQTILKV